MNKLVGLAITVLFSVIMLPILATHLSWIAVDDSTITQKGTKTFQLIIDAADTIPQNAGAGVLAGYAWLYDPATTTDTVFAITTHEPIRDSHQNPDGWHAHNVKLVGSNDSSLATFCIESLSGYVQAGISIKGDRMKINVPATTLSGALSASAVAFDIIPTDPADAICGETLLADGYP